MSDSPLIKRLTKAAVCPNEPGAAGPSFNLISIRQSGQPVSALEHYFNADMAQAELRQNQRGCPSDTHVKYANDLILDGMLTPVRGVAFPSTESMSSFLLARDSSSMEVLGFVKYSMGLRFDENLDADAESEQAETDDLREFGVGIGVDFIYVCHNHRGQGIGEGIMCTLAAQFEALLESLAAALSPCSQQLNLRFKIAPELEAEFVSTSGEAMLEILKSHVTGVCKDFRRRARKGTKRHALDVNPDVNDDACDF